MRTLEHASPQSIVRMARESFEEVHNNQIATLIYNFPLDYTTDKGIPFWTAPKRPPQVIPYDSNEKSGMVMSFIYSAANIFAHIYNQKPLTFEQVKKISDGLDIRFKMQNLIIA